MQSVSITTNVVSSNPTLTRYAHYVIKMHGIHCENAINIKQAIQTLLQKQKPSIIWQTQASCFEMGRFICRTLNYSQRISVDNDMCFKSSERSVI